MKTILVFDGSNIAHRTYFAHQQQAGNDISGVALHYALTTFNKYYKVYSPTITFVAFDRSNWRKMYTQSGKCLTKAVYKANRRQNMTPQQQQLYTQFQQHILELEELLKNHTTVRTLSANMLEADDLIAGLVSRFPDDKVVIISADGDYKQLLKYDNVTLINPIDDKQVFCDDVDWFMFEKCIRGDTGDNVKSAFPKVRKTRLEKAFNDPIEYTSLMAEEWSDGETTYKVSELFAENQLLMDLSKQPDAVKDIINRCIDAEMEAHKKYNHFNFVKFCGSNGLQRIVESSNQYMKFLSA